MSLNVSYKNPMGFVTEKGKKGRAWLCHANLKLWAEIQTCKHSDGKWYRNLGLFFLDNEHLKRCVMSKDYPINFKGVTYHFNTAEKCTISKETIRLLTYAGAKVEFYYKQRKRNVII